MSMTKEQEEAIEYLKQFSELMKKWEATEIFSNIGTVLNMLKEKDEEIEKLKADNKKAWELNANMSQRHLSDILKIKKKDRQIDLMAKAFKQDDVRSIEELKQYFERKATNDG